MRGVYVLPVELKTAAVGQHAARKEGQVVHLQPWIALPAAGCAQQLPQCSRQHPRPHLPPLLALGNDRRPLQTYLQIHIHLLIVMWLTSGKLDVRPAHCHFQPFVGDDQNIKPHCIMDERINTDRNIYLSPVNCVAYCRGMQWRSRVALKCPHTLVQGSGGTGNE